MNPTYDVQEIAAILRKRLAAGEEVSQYGDSFGVAAWMQAMHQLQRESTTPQRIEHCAEDMIFILEQVFDPNGGLDPSTGGSFTERFKRLNQTYTEFERDEARRLLFGADHASSLV